jgi:hypothetical protein
MKKSASGSLRSLLTESAPLRQLPVGVVRQLVGYYGDWRRSRDILNDAASEPPAASPLQYLFRRGTISNSSRSYRAQ